MSTKEITVFYEDDGQRKAIVDPKQLYVPPTYAQLRGKRMSEEQIAKVVSNRPMPRVPRTNVAPGNAAEVANKLLARIFPNFTAIYEESKDRGDFRSFDATIEESAKQHVALGLQQQANSMRQQAESYKALRKIFLKEDDFLKPDSIIPMEYLPDLFMAVPVWYFWESATMARNNSSRGQMVTNALAHFACKVGSQQWSDTFLMFNYRHRTLADYDGDIIPPKIIKRMQEVAHLCEHMVVMTPYHDKVGQDWQNLSWPRNIDPYVIGFLKNVPFMIVLGRFSDSGTFPLYSEMVADTVEFLRQNKEKLQKFDISGNPNRWLVNGQFAWQNRLGAHLTRRADQIIEQFENATLFDWLRGQEMKKA